MNAHTYNAPDWRYWFDFVFFPALALGVAAYDARSAAWVAWAVLGFVAWTFIEYWTHRTLLHVWFWHGTHERHHKAPAEYVIFPIWILPAAWIIGGAVCAVFAGFLTLSTESNLHNRPMPW